ncbi:MAG: retroviral-like aspartic protease family protein [Candidatus Melainabacteria bacterium]|nr:retroviral-like aspartic protease family protein [Candidatus Melainabacteria bacterium]
MMLKTGGWRRTILTILPGLVLSMTAGAGRVVGADAYSTGVQLLTARKFPQAAQYFSQAVKASPRQGMALYYLGLSKHYQGDRQGAMESYSRVLSEYPGTEACNLAVRGMSSIDPSILQQLGLAGGGQSSGRRQQRQGQEASGGGDDLSMPSECRVNFTKESNCMIVDGRVNGRSTRMLFDTGAENVVFGMNHIQEMGINLGKSEQSVNVTGSGSRGSQKSEVHLVELTLGNIVRKNFPILVMEHADNYPIIGQRFFNELKYTVDNNSNCITFQRRTGQVASNAPLTAYDVPFERDGKEIRVMTEIEGKKVPMWFDTGASWVVMSASQAQACGITVPDDARVVQTRGVNGLSRTRFVRVRSMRLGPVDKRDYEIGVADSLGSPYPLLGGDFLQNQQFTIDYDRGVIHFGRH